MSYSSPHAVVVSLPFLGHVSPLLQLSHFLTNNDFIITFINIEQTQNAVSTNDDSRSDQNQIRMISIHDGLPVEDKRHDHNFFVALEKNMPAKLERVMKEINEREEGEKITCLIVDSGMAWALQVAEKMGIHGVAFSPASGSNLAVLYSIPKLIKDGIIDENGFPRNQEKFRLTTTTPLMNLTYLLWNYMGDENTQKGMFHYAARNEKALSKAHFILVNSSEELELPIFTSFPNIRPIGPLCIDQVEKIGTQIAQYSEDTSCMTWLDQQESGSVVYVSFGSIATLSQNQFEELGLGLELSQMRFLWITRPDLTDSKDSIFLKQFEERVKQRGKIAEWCNQKKVLAHPSIACFISHCGWNSTMEGVKNGVRFLCWPYFVDQFANQDYICDVLNVGLCVVKNENGFVTKENIRSSLVGLMENDEMKERAEKLKGIVNKSIVEGGSSFVNLSKFVEAIKQ